jgi:hypothetical protein
LIAASGAFFLLAIYLWWPLIRAGFQKLRTSTTFRAWIEVGVLGVIVIAGAISYDRITGNHEVELKTLGDKLVTVEADRDLKAAQMDALQQRVDLLTAALTSSTGNTSIAQTVTDSVEVPLGPLSLATRTGVTPETYATTMESLRAENGLRELTDTELGRPFGEMATSTYSFLYPGHLTTGDAGFARMPREVLTYEEGQSEVQRRTDGEIHLIVFAEESALPLVANLDGRQERTIDTFARPSGQRTALISLPITRIRKVTTRPTNPTAVEFTIR